MNEKELLAKISLLKQIQPRQDWVLLTKSRILGTKQSMPVFKIGDFFRLISDFQHLKPAFALAAFALLIFAGAMFQLRSRETALAPDIKAAIKVYEENAAKVSQDLAQLVEKNPQKALQVSLGVIQLQKDKRQLENVLGTSIGGGTDAEFQNTTKTLLENELKELETRTLSEEQKVLFEQAKAAYDAGDYETALEIILTLTNNQ